MDIKAWWNKKRRYPSGDVFSRGETIIYVLIIKLRPRLKFTALKRWMHRNQST